MAYKLGPGLPFSVVMKLKPTFEGLNDEKLLTQCLHGLTQNHIESFNQIFWERIPSSMYHLPELNAVFMMP